QLTLNTWHHVAVVRDNNHDITIYIDGVAETDSFSTVNFTGTVGRSDLDLRIGSYHFSQGFNYAGYMEQLRIKAEAVYTADFTPPTAPF
ncbi:MAG: LamG-like jellyroll fold domain-containing protein, partial [Cyanobacteria bacterium P01_D01_bin.115]